MSQDSASQTLPVTKEEEMVGACGRRLVWVPNIEGRLALAVEPSEKPAAPPCSRCRRICPGHQLFAEQEAPLSLRQALAFGQTSAPERSWDQE